MLNSVKDLQRGAKSSDILNAPAAAPGGALPIPPTPTPPFPGSDGDIKSAEQIKMLPSNLKKKGSRREKSECANREEEFKREPTGYVNLRASLSFSRRQPLAKAAPRAGGWAEGMREPSFVVAGTL